MAISSSVFAWGHNRAPELPASLKIGSPFEIRSIAGFGLIFLIIQLAGTLGQRFLDTYGTIGVSILGGFASSASPLRLPAWRVTAR